MAATKVGFQLASSLASKHLTDAEFIKGGFLVVDTTAARDTLPIATETTDGVIVKGSLCYCTGDSKFYQFNGTNWVEKEFGTTTEASQTTAGLMSAADKEKLDGIDTGANQYEHPSTHAASMITGLAAVATSGSYNDLTNIPDTFAPSSHEHDYIPTIQKGAANGVAELDSNGKVPSSQLPSYVDDIIEGLYENETSFKVDSAAVTGETGKIYVDTTTNKTYRWSGSTYVEISASLALGETSSTAYAGDKGKAAYDHSLITTNNPHKVTKVDVLLGDVVNTGDSAIPVEGGTTKFTTGGAYTELNKKVDKTITINGHELSSNIQLDKTDIGLDKVENKSSTEIRNELTKDNVTTALGYTPLDKDTWVANSAAAAGYVEKGEGNPNKVWATDADGNPTWRDEINSNLVNGEGVDSIVQKYSGEVDDTHYGNTNTGESAVVFGEANNNTANRALMSGKLNNNACPNSNVGGFGNTVGSGGNNNVTGNINYVINYNNVVGGYGNKVECSNAYTGGANNWNKADQTIVAGELNENKPDAINSLLIGKGLINSNPNALICGRYNAKKSDTLFEVGNGVENYAGIVRNNAFEVLEDGRAKSYVDLSKTTLEDNDLVTVAWVRANFAALLKEYLTGNNVTTDDITSIFNQEA